MFFEEPFDALGTERYDEQRDRRSEYGAALESSSGRQVAVNDDVQPEQQDCRRSSGLVTVRTIFDITRTPGQCAF